MLVPSRRSRLGLALCPVPSLSYTSPLLALQNVLLPLKATTMAVISLAPTPLPLSPHHAMNLPSLPSEVFNITASYPSSWQPFHTITPPWSSKPHHPTMTTLPPISSLQRQYQYRDTARSSRLLLFLLPSFNSAHSTSSCSSPSTTTTTTTTPSHTNSSSSSRCVAPPSTLWSQLCLGTEASDATS